MIETLRPFMIQYAFNSININISTSLAFGSRVSRRSLPILGHVRGLGSYLSGWWLSNPSEKYESQFLDDELPDTWKNDTCSKPPTSCTYSPTYC